MIKKQLTVLLNPLLACCLTLLLATSVLAQDVVLSDVKIEGLNRVESATVLGSITAKKGAIYNQDVGIESIRNLFALGMFADVDVDLQDDILVIKIKENPTIAEIDFVGSKVIKKADLKKSIAAMGLVEGYAFNKSLIEQVRREIKRSYLQQGRFASDVVLKTEPVNKGQIKLTFEIYESNSTKVNSINIRGNNSFPSSRLLDEFKLSAGGWFSWYTKANQYNTEKLNIDLAALTAFYKNRGFLEFSIDSSSVAVTPDKSKVDINIKVNEGKRFSVTKVEIKGNLLSREKDFYKLLAMPVGEVYNESLVQKSIKNMTDYFGEFGYAFSKVQVLPKIDRENAVVELTFALESNMRAYVRRINIQGNVSTKDEVIRRELRQFEGQWYDTNLIKRSKLRLDRLGFFANVEIKPQPVENSADLIDLVVKVEEQRTGSVNVGMSYSELDKIGLNFGIAQSNFMGTGNALSASTNIGKYNKQLSVSTTDPYFTKDGVSRSYNLFYSQQKPYDSMGGDYLTTTYGGSVDFGVPFGEDDRVFFGIGAQKYKIKTGTNTPPYVLEYTRDHGNNSVLFPLTASWVKNTTNSAVAPNSGSIKQISLETALFGKLRYIKAEASYQQFIPLTKKITFSFNAEYDWGKGLGGKVYPFYKNYIGGGIGSVRGFAQGSLGPQDASGNIAGGTKKLVLNNELIFQVPGLDQSIRTFLFVDIGNVYKYNQPIKFKELRSSYGIGLNWLSPIGLLSFSWGKPIKIFPGDQVNKFQFTMGNYF